MNGKRNNEESFETYRRLEYDGGKTLRRRMRDDDCEKMTARQRRRENNSEKLANSFWWCKDVLYRRYMDAIS